ncbi:MAG: response regulator [Bacteroidota bacterium]|mgnify:CR=1 FL=1
MISIVITDDHKIVRDGIRAILTGVSGIKVTGEASDTLQLREILKNSVPDVLLLDIIMPGESGLDAIPALLKTAPGMRILILSSEMDEETICEAVSRGALGFLHKDSSRQELLRAIESVSAGEPFFGQCIAGIIYKSYTKKLQENSVSGRESITPREREIIELLAEGLCFKEIGEKLFISPRTVENHKNNILAKLELKNTIELLRYAIKHKLIHI